jgi:hypothetical protein
VIGGFTEINLNSGGRSKAHRRRAKEKPFLKIAGLTKVKGIWCARMFRGEEATSR